MRLTRHITILRISGIPIRIDASWLIIAVVLTASLAVNFAIMLPSDQYPEFTTVSYWLMAGAAVIGLFLCVILHELGHSLVAQRFGMQIRSITLFIFGGVADLEGEPRSAKAEFWMASAGPVVSVLLAGVFWLLYRLGQTANWPVAALMVVWQLAVLNLVLVVFNLVPAFPLDGGRVLRAILWGITGSLKRATGIAAVLGRGFGTVMMVLGFLAALAGDLVAGIWWIMLGWILRDAAQSGYMQVIIRGALEGEPIRRFMTAKVTCVAPDLDVERLVEDYFYKEHHKLYPVCADGRLLGYVTAKQIKAIPREEWRQHRVAEIMATDLEEMQIPSGTDALDVLARMQRNDQSRLLVVDDGTLVGILSLKDLLDFLNLKIELEKESGS